MALSLSMVVSLLGTGCGDSDAPVDQHSNLNYVFPLRFGYSHYENHLLQWLPDDSPYEMVEAFVNQEHPATTFFFLTEREAAAGSKRQYCYTNNEDLFRALDAGTGDRESWLVDIDTDVEEQGGDTQFHIRLDTLGGETDWKFTSNGQPEAKYADRLIDNANASHDLKSGILVFYLPESTVASSDTTLIEGTRRYPAQSWTQISVPPYFEAYRGVWSRNVHDGYFYALEATRFRSWQRVGRLARGVTYQQDMMTDTDSEGYSATIEATAVEGNRITLCEDSWFCAELEVVGADLLTHALYATSHDYSMRVEFVPALPDVRTLAQGTTHHEFSILLAGVEGAVMSGNLELEKQGQRVALELQPNSPDWSQVLQLVVEIRLSSDEYQYQSHTLYPGSSSAQSHSAELRHASGSRRRPAELSQAVAAGVQRP